MTGLCDLAGGFGVENLGGIARSGGDDRPEGSDSETARLRGGGTGMPACGFRAGGGGAVLAGDGGATDAGLGGGGGGGALPGTTKFDLFGDTPGGVEVRGGTAGTALGMIGGAFVGGGFAGDGRDGGGGGLALRKGGGARRGGGGAADVLPGKLGAGRPGGAGGCPAGLVGGGAAGLAGAGGVGLGGAGTFFAGASALGTEGGLPSVGGFAMNVNKMR